MLLLKASEMRSCEKKAIDELGLPSLALMETAGRAVAQRGLELLEDTGGDTCLVLCGAGNNGGDGFVAARYLALAGVELHCICTCSHEAMKGDARIFHDVISRMGLRIDYVDRDEQPLPPIEVGRGDLVIDALLGTGLCRAPSGRVKSLIEACRSLQEAGVQVLSVDLPSGVQADDGQTPGAAVQADATVSFGYLKRGHLHHPGAALCGDWERVDIGLPSWGVEAGGARCELLDEAQIRDLLPASVVTSHKGSLGHVLVIAGSAQKPGAAALACEGALRSGAGLVTLASRPGGHACVHARQPEVMGVTLAGEGPLDKNDLESLRDAMPGKDAILIGPGIPRSDATRELLRSLLHEAQVPVVLDADALNAIGEDRSVFESRETPGIELVLTPHPGEMARMLGSTNAKVQADRYAAATRLAAETGATVVLKGANSVIADPEGDLAVNPTGHAGLATGGSGDVLGGIVAALLARGLGARAASRVGVFAHGAAADLLQKERGHAGLLAGDLGDGLAQLWANWER